MIATRRRNFVLPILVFAIGTAVSVWLFTWLIQQQEEKIRSDFARVASDRSEAVVRRLQDDLMIPESLRQLFDASDEVNEDEFARFSGPILRRTPELRAVAWAAEMVDASGKTSYPIRYMDMAGEKGAIQSRDLNGIPGLTAAIEESKKTNSPAWINLEPDVKDSHIKSDWVVVLPVLGDDVEGGSKPLKSGQQTGILLARINLRLLLDTAFKGLARVGVDSAIYADSPKGRRLLALRESITREQPYDAAREKSDEYVFLRPIDLGRETWTIYFRPAPVFLAKYAWLEQKFILLGGLALSTLVATYLLREDLRKEFLRLHNGKVRVLQDVAVAANKAETNADLLEECLRVTGNYLNGAFGHVYITDELRPELLISSGIFFMDDDSDWEPLLEETGKLSFDKGSGIPGRVLESGQMVFVPNVMESPDFLRKKSAGATGVRSMIAFPVIVRQKVTAVVEIFHRNTFQPFDGWQELLTGVGVQISHAMERKLAADELVEKNTVLENAVEGIAHLDTEGIYLSVNKAYARMSGLPVQELLGTNGRQRVHPEDGPFFQAAYVEMILQGRAEVSVRRLRADGSIYFQELTMVRDSDRAGKLRGVYLFARDVTEREEQQAALREGEERFFTFMQHNPSIMSLRDEEGRFIYVNPAAEKALGLQLNAVQGKSIYDLFDPASAEVIRKTDAAVLESDAPIDLIENLPSADGGLRQWHVWKFVIKQNSGRRYVGSLGIDVTASKKAELDMAAARDAAMESARLKSQFLANMSHEIRTPMNGLIGMLGLLAKTKLEAPQRDFLETAQSASDSLLRLLNDILDFSKIEAGKLEMEAVVFDPRHCLHHAVKILAENARQKGLSLTAHIADNVPARLLGDSGRLTQIIVNLVNNGIKFTHAGSVAVSFEVERRIEGSLLLLHGIVRDTGIGIRPEQREHIFQPFRQSDNSTARQYGGTGLGLAICSQLAELMGGTIWVENEPTGGSAFHFTLQMEETSETLPEALPATSTGIRAAKSLRILLAEDNEINQRLARILLEERGHRVTLAVDGNAAVAHFQNADFDLILMDVQMPGKDGYEATREIRKDERGREIAIYALTAHAMPEDRRHCLEAGMNGYLTKPIRVDEFSRVIEEKVTRNRELPSQKEIFREVKTRRIDWTPQRMAVVKTQEIKREASDLKAFDLTALRQQVNFNDALILELAASFKHQAGEDLRQIQRALSERDSVLLERSAHRLRGSAVSLFASSLAQSAQSLETFGRANNFDRAQAELGNFESAFATLSQELGSLSE